MNLVRACPLQKPIQHCSLESFVMWEGPEDALGTSPKLFGSHCLLHPACQVTDKQSPVLASTVICKQDQDQIERGLEQPLCKAKASQLSPVEGGTITQGAPPQSELCIYPGESERLPPAAGFPTSGWQVKTSL